MNRVVTVIDAGRIQIEGAVVMGIGMALLEHTTYDPQNGAPINSNLADYIVAVNADVSLIDVHFLDYPDLELNAVGARGIGRLDYPVSPLPSRRRSTTRPAFVCASSRSESKTSSAPRC